MGALLKKNNRNYREGKMSNIVNFGIGITLADHFTNRLHGAEKGVTSFTTKLAALSTVSAGVGSKMLASFGDFTQKFAEVAQKQGDIMSLGIDTQGMEAITAKAIAFSDTWSGVVAKDFIGASYDIKSGIESLTNDGVGEMTRYALLTAKATKASSDTMAKVFAMGHGIFRDEFDTDFEFGAKFSATISAAVKSFRTDGADLASGFATIGAVSKKMGVSLSDTLAVLGMSKSSFNTASEGATSYKAFLSGAVKAQKSLGLSFVDSKGKLLPMANILEKLKSKFGDLNATEIGTIKKAFGSDEAVKIILALIDKTDGLRKAENNLKKAQKQGIDYTKKMAQAREYGQEYGKLSNQFENFGYIIGKQLSPAMSWLSTQFGDFINKIVSFVGKHEKMAQTIATGAVAFATTATVLGTVGIAIAGVGFGLSTLGLSFSGMLALSIPLVAVVGTIAVAGYALYKNWDRVESTFSSFVNGVQKGLGVLNPFVKRIKTAFTPMFDMFKKVSLKIKTFFNFTPNDNISGWGTTVGQALRGLIEIATISIEGLTRLFNYTVKGWSNIFSWVPDGTISESLSVMGDIWSTAMDGWGEIVKFGMSLIRGEVSFDPSAIVSNIWNGLGTVFSTALDGWWLIISSVWKYITEQISWNPMDTIRPLWDKVTNFLSDAWAKVTGIFTKVKSIGSSISSEMGDAWDSVSDFAINMMGGDTKVDNRSATSFVLPQKKAMATVPTIVPARNSANTIINEGANTFSFHIKGDNPQEIANKVKAMLDAQNRDKRQRSIE